MTTTQDAIKSWQSLTKYLNFRIHGVFSRLDQLCLHSLLFSFSVTLPEHILNLVDITTADSISEGRCQGTQAKWIAEAGTEESLRILQTSITVVIRWSLWLLLLLLHWLLLRLSTCLMFPGQHQKIISLHLRCLERATAKYSTQGP